MNCRGVIGRRHEYRAVVDTSVISKFWWQSMYSILGPLHSAAGIRIFQSFFWGEANHGGICDRDGSVMWSIDYL